MNASPTRSQNQNPAPRLEFRKPAEVNRTPNAIVSVGGRCVDLGQRQLMIAEAAYYYAQRRGFERGHELDDWLAAQDQIDAALRLDEIHSVYGD
jgi:hypothetical protein